MPAYKVNKQTGNPDTLIAGGTVFADTPIGTIISSGRAYDNPPDGYFFCDGRALSRTTYADLFAAIGTAFGSGDGSTTFNIPDGREATFKGAGLTSKSNNHYDTDGVALGEFIEDRVQTHSHNVNIMPVNSGTSGSFCSDYYTSLDQDSGNSNYTGINKSGRSGATTEVKAFGVNYFIKATNVPVPADFMSAVDDAVEVAMEDVGTIVEAKTDEEISIDVSNKTVQEITLSKGTWIIRGQVTNTANGAGSTEYRSISISPNSGSWNQNFYSAISNPFVSQGQEVTAIVNVTASSQTYYLTVDGGGKVDKRYMSAVRIK